jgi:hypothetical protein
VSVTLTNNTIKDAQFYGICIGSSNVTINATGNTIDHPAQTAIYVQGGAVGSAYFDSIDLINRVPGKLVYKNDAPSTFTVTFGKHNVGIPDTLPVAVRDPVAGIEKESHMTIFPSQHLLVINYFTTGEKGTVDVAIYSALGRLVSSGTGSYSHEGPNNITWRSDKFCAGIYFAVIRSANLTETHRFMIN